MRISDWSSDVCSSDLPFRYRVGLRTNNSSPIMNLGLVIIKRLGVSHHGIQLTQSIRIKLARSSPLGATSFPLGGRSEEHTSELQSLMRISYAVICLK